MSKDPVCGMKIDSKNPAKKVIYSGKEYHFCSNDCKEKFISNPEKYLKEKKE
ncbi:MAG: YHS domain-containing protein [Calditrichia bacterium]